ncbi:MAG TPA: hypothetical protein VIS51_04340 [Solirubrobacterales bacterium]
MTLGSMFGAMFGGPAEPVAPKFVLKGLGVSTVETPDMGFETAILDANGTHPVERYDTRIEAVLGHLEWAERCLHGLAGITKLGYGDLVKEKQVVLEPVPGMTIGADGIFVRP